MLRLLLKSATATEGFIIRANGEMLPCTVRRSSAGGMLALEIEWTEGELAAPPERAKRVSGPQEAVNPEVLGAAELCITNENMTILQLAIAANVRVSWLNGYLRSDSSKRTTQLEQQKLRKFLLQNGYMASENPVNFPQYCPPVENT